MAEILRADIGKFNGTTFTRLVPPPVEDAYVMPPGNFVFVNADNASRVFEIEIRKGDLTIMIFNDTLIAGEPYAWPFELVVREGFDGIYGRVTTAPTTEPVWYYAGRIEI